MKVGVYTNKYKDKNFTVTKKAESILSGFKIDSVRLNDGDSPVGLDYVITVGGDGTILGIALSCAKLNIPILAINCGTLGFLTETEQSQLSDCIERINSHNYTIEKREFIQVCAHDKTYNALNDAVIFRDSNHRLITLELSCNKQIVDRFGCDGYIVCTPTGSTAYSLSAGGAVISPSARVMGLTPLSAHSLNTRPMIVGLDELICIKNLSAEGDASLFIDGRRVCKIACKDCISISGSNLSVGFIRFKEHSFYYRLLDKLGKPPPDID